MKTVRAVSNCVVQLGVRAIELKAGQTLEVEDSVADDLCRPERTLRFEHVDAKKSTAPAKEE